MRPATPETAKASQSAAPSEDGADSRGAGPRSSFLSLDFLPTDHDERRVRDGLLGAPFGHSANVIGPPCRRNTNSLRRLPLPLPPGPRSVGPMRFSANLSMLFTDAPLLERFARARAAGFGAVELWWPRGEDLGRVAEAIAAARLGVAVLNFDAGDMPRGDRGLLSDPDRDEHFRASVPVALDLAGRIGCRWLNALVGVEVPGVAREAQLELARANLAWAA